jgi:hypothetical protein
MIDIDLVIREKLNLQDTTDLKCYSDLKTREEYHLKIRDIINEYIPKVENCHEKEHEDLLKKQGYVLFENFFDEEQIKSLVDYTKDKPGYNFHVPNRAYNKETKIFSEDLDWNILSYNTDVLLQNELILKVMTDTKLVSLVQSYFGCMPTIHMLSMWWSVYTGEIFHTQKIHRDIDDYKFLTLFVYLTDIDEDNGPHIFYPGTHNGSDNLSGKKVITGKAGTAVLADTYAWHHGAPLNQGKRLLMYNRFGLFKNNNYFRDESHLNVQDENVFFDKIEDNYTNRYLLRLFTK